MGKVGDTGVQVVKPGRARGLGRVVSTKRALAEVVVAPRSKAPGPRPWEPDGSIDVEALAVWALRDQKADRYEASGMHEIEAQAAGMMRFGRSTDGCAALAEIEHMGCRIDRGGVTVRSDLVHPAALAVLAELGNVPDGGLVLLHCRAGGCPDWREPPRWFQPLAWIKYGEEAMCERSGRGRSPFVTRVLPVSTPAEVARKRAEYGRWWEALDHLQFRLATRALGFTVTRPAAPLEPWVQGGER